MPLRLVISVQFALTVIFLLWLRQSKWPRLVKIIVGTLLIILALGHIAAFYFAPISEGIGF